MIDSDTADDSSSNEMDKINSQLDVLVETSLANDTENDSTSESSPNDKESVNSSDSKSESEGEANENDTESSNTQSSESIESNESPDQPITESIDDDGDTQIRYDSIILGLSNDASLDKARYNKFNLSLGFVSKPKDDQYLLELPGPKVASVRKSIMIKTPSLVTNSINYYLH